MIAAQTTSREKSNFLAAATHDLRQPMHALNLFLQAAAEAIRSGEYAQAERLMNECGRSSVILARLLNAVFDLSRLESGRVVPRYHVFDVQQIVKEAAQLRPFAMSRGSEIRLRLPKEEVVCVRSDAHRLGRAIANLMSNGIKYADKGKDTKATVIVGVVRSPTRTHRRAGQRHWHSPRLLRGDFSAVLSCGQSGAGSRQGRGARAVHR